MLKTDETTTKAIHAMETEFPQRYNAGQFDRLVQDFYTDDARLLPPHAPACEGRPAVLAFMKEVSGVLKNLRIEPGSVVVSGDLAISTGRFRSTVTTPNGGKIEDTGKFVEAFRREPNGSWRCFVDIFNSDLAPRA